MAGSISLSLTQRYDKTTHLPLEGGQVTFYAAGTTTPQSAYQDISLTIPWPNPITLDSGGNVPQLFFADGYIKFRLANAAGVTQIEADFVLVLGPTSGAGAAPSVDATTILQTGWIQPIYGTGNVTGFVRLNGRTIGSATSGATERADADTTALFSFLWSADTTLAVSGGRGASAAADYAANKTIALPDARGRVLAGLNDMGNTNAGIVNPLPAAVQKGDTITLGSLIGLGTPHSLVTANLPPYTPAGTVSGTITGTASSGQVTTNGLGGGASAVVAPTYINGTADGRSLGVTGTFTGSITGGTPQGGTSTSFDVNPAMMLITLYLKL